jgi:transcriptional regulator with XRE-family HTH domain
MRSIAEQIRNARKEKKLTQRELGKKMGWPQSYISKIESGEIDMRLSSILDLVRFLDLDVFLVPRPLIPVVTAIISGAHHPSKGPAWGVDEDMV